MNKTDLFYPLFRLGLILGPLLSGIFVVAPIFQPAMTITPSAPHSSKESVFSGAVSLPSSEVNLDYPDFRSAPKTIAPGAIDPRELFARFQSGITAMTTSSDDETRREGARQVRIAAINGYEPARMLLAREFPRSPLVSSIVLSSEAVRFSLDPVFLSGPQSDGNRRSVALLAAYFSGRHELDAYAADLLTALRDDPRLQSNNSLRVLFNELMRVSGACTALANAVVKQRILTEPVCSSRLQQQIENFLRVSSTEWR